MADYHMHKQENEIDDPEVIEQILSKGRYATVAMCRGPEPYLVTLNYGYDQARRALFFHSALEGLKLGFLAADSRVCATVIEDHGYRHGKCSHAYRSAVFWGAMGLVEGLAEKVHGMNILLNHLEEDPEPLRERLLSKETDYDGVAILRLDIESITGKEGS